MNETPDSMSSKTQCEQCIHDTVCMPALKTINAMHGAIAACPHYGPAPTKPQAGKREPSAQQIETAKWKAEGHAVWYEDGTVCHAPVVDAEKFGEHHYPYDGGTSDCVYDCGCWMGPYRSGGEVDPFGPCPKNPKGATDDQTT